MGDLRPCYRLKKRKEFSHVFATGRSAAGNLMVVYSLSRDGGSVRVGFSAGKKLGNAVLRNRVRRRIKEIVRKFLPHLVPSRDLVVIVRAGAVKATCSELEKEFQLICRRLKLWSMP
ncbi:MAG: Ribonuclease P protein component [Firmicutes bacterium]|nr:Ribonuclease P protein component [Bacillota bacterium]